MDEVEYLLHNLYLFILCQRLSSLRLASLTAKVRLSSILVKSLTFWCQLCNLIAIIHETKKNSDKEKRS